MIKTGDLKIKMEALETKLKRSVCDYSDAISKNKETIISLVAQNQQLEWEHETMSRMLKQNYTTGTELYRLIETNTAGKEEANEGLATARRLETHVKNLLDTLLETEKYCTRHGEDKQDMRSALNRAHDTTQLLGDKLALSRIRTCDMMKQLEPVQQGAVPAGAHCTAFDAIKRETDDLRNFV